VRRFEAPARGRVSASRFAHPIYRDIVPFLDLLAGAEWPALEALNARLALPGKRLAVQDAALLADGLHYEQRIAEHGTIATRSRNWHDLFNALVWAVYPDVKVALNARQCHHIAGMGTRQRNRAQAALTQFDESGLIVRVRTPALLAAWDAHGWDALFVHGAARWAVGDINIAAVVGHALMEQALLPDRLLVGKCVVVQGDEDEAGIAAVAHAIAEGAVLNDPLELRPLPMGGIPGWHSPQDAAFRARVDYFRPLRAGRTYPAPLRLAQEQSTMGRLYPARQHR